VCVVINGVYKLSEFFINTKVLTEQNKLLMAVKDILQVWCRCV